MKTTKLLITGSAGFIFSNFVRYVLKNYKEYDVASIDCVDLSIGLHNVYANKGHTFYMANVLDKHILDNIFTIEKPDIVIHGAAKSFVDEAIEKPSDFYLNNIVGTQNMIDASIKHNVQKFILMSTDEVMGHFDSDNGQSWNEEAPLNPRNPYSASKAGAELAVKSSSYTFGLNYNIIRSCNNFGPRQNPRSFIPKIIKCILNNEKIPIYSKGENIREWIYVLDTCSAIIKIIQSGKENEIYNIGTGYEISNLELVNLICNISGRGQNLIEFVTDRKGHDFRYALNSQKLKNLGWAPEWKFRASLEQCYSWFQKNTWFYK